MLVHNASSCCRRDDPHRLSVRGAMSRTSCAALCEQLPSCTHFSFSGRFTMCFLCSACHFDGLAADARYISWSRPAPQQQLQPTAAHCLLLLGDSRDRFLYHDILDASCTRARSVNWSRCRGGAVEVSQAWSKLLSGVNRSRDLYTRRLAETVGGAECTPALQLASSSGQSVALRFLAHLSHWGVAEDRYHLRTSRGAFQGWVTHPHPGWQGEGWQEAAEFDAATGVPDARPSSPQLILEAAQRFHAATLQLGCTQSEIVFSSFLWDLYRFVRTARTRLTFVNARLFVCRLG